jgi:hypothetical protein
MPGLVVRDLTVFFAAGFFLVAMSQPVNAQATRAIIASAAATTKA